MSFQNQEGEILLFDEGIETVFKFDKHPRKNFTKNILEKVKQGFDS
jgi:hypothetical protein